MTPKTHRITVEHNSLKPSSLYPDTFNQHQSPCLSIFISPTDSDMLPSNEPQNPTSPPQTPLDQLQSAQFLSPTSFFQQYLHLPNKSNTSSNGRFQYKGSIDLESQFHSSAHGVNLRTHIWGEPSNNMNRTMSETRSSSGGKEAFGVRKETNVFIKEEMLNCDIHQPK